MVSGNEVKGGNKNDYRTSNIMNNQRGMGLLCILVGVWVMVQNPSDPTAGAIVAGIGLLVFASR